MTHPFVRDQNRRPVACGDCGLYRLCVTLGLGGDDAVLLDSVVRRKRIYKRSEFLFHAGEPAEHVYAIRSGSVKTYLTTRTGRVQVTGLHLAGELLGLAGLDSRAYSCEAQALETTSACQLSLKQLEQAALLAPAVHRQMLRIMASQIRHYEQLLLLLGKHNAEQRLAAFLLALSQRLALRNFSATQLSLSMSRGEIGNYLGIAEETVCRLFARFQEQGLVEVRRRHVRLDDLARLRVIAQEQAAPAPAAGASLGSSQAPVPDAEPSAPSALSH